jgi:hypothetical protein
MQTILSGIRRQYASLCAGWLSGLQKMQLDLNFYDILLDKSNILWYNSHQLEGIVTLE